jgi:hypothetical protein
MSKATFIAAGGLILLLLFSFGIAQIGPCEDKFAKALISAPLLTILLIISLELGARTKSSEWQKLRATAFVVIVIAVLFMIAEMLLPHYFSADKINYHKEFKYSGIFSEPSHVAISLFPCIAILFSSKDKKYNRKGIFAIIVLFALSHSASLAVLTLCLVAYRLLILSRIKQGLKYLAIIAIIIAIGITLDYELFIAPTVERVGGVTSLIAEESTPAPKINLSSMIYYKGWQDAFANIVRTNGLGLGFNMMGCSPLPDNPLRRIFSIPGKEDSNNEDGSFLLSKILSEFGLIGLIFFLWAIWRWLKFEKMAKKLTGYENIEAASIHKVLMLSFIMSSIVRSTGYFQGSALLWATALIASIKLLQKKESVQID